MNDGQEQSSSSAPTELDLLKQRAKMMGVVFSNNIKIETLRQKIKAKLDDEDDTQILEEDETNEDQTTQDQSGENLEEAGSGSSGNSNKSDTGNGSSGAEEAEPIAASSDTGPIDHQSPIEEVIVTAPMQAPDPIPVVPASMQAPVPTAPVRKLSLRELMQREHMKLIRVRIANLDPKKKDLPGEIFTVANEFIGTIRKYIPYGEVTDEGWHITKILYEQLRDRKFLNISTTKDRRSGHIQTKQVWVKEFALEVLPDLTQEELNHLAIAQAAAGSLDGQL